jgi:hypothetical protein
MNITGYNCRDDLLFKIKGQSFYHRQKMQLCCLTGCPEKVVKSEQEDWEMAKFDPDFSIFGTLAGDIVGGVPIEKTRVDYVNNACVRPYVSLIER